MTVRKPNRVTTPKRAVLNGTRTSHDSMPRTRGRWRPGVTRNRASASPPPARVGRAGRARTRFDRSDREGAPR